MTNSVANKLMDKLQSQVNEYSKEYLDLQIQIKQLSDKQNQLKEKLKNTLTELEVNENAPLTIAETDANIPVCTVSEAVMYMDFRNEYALMFRNSANNHISMVYRRKDGNIGWVEPKADN